MIRVGATEGTSAIAPARREDAAAALCVAAVEFDEMAASFTDVVGMGIDRRAAARAIGRVVWRSGVDDRIRDWDLAPPRTAHHGSTMDRRRAIVDPRIRRNERTI